jgi:hypothetical protein
MPVLERASSLGRPSRLGHAGWCRWARSGAWAWACVWVWVLPGHVARPRTKQTAKSSHLIHSRREGLYLSHTDAIYQQGQGTSSFSPRTKHTEHPHLFWRGRPCYPANSSSTRRARPVSCCREASSTFVVQELGAGPPTGRPRSSSALSRQLEVARHIPSASLLVAWLF